MGQGRPRRADIYKIDVLALGMLTALRKSFELIKQHYGEDHGLDMPTGRSQRSTRCCARPTRSACSRSRAGRRCRCCRGSSRDEYYDLVVEVAIVRPGPDPGRHGASLSAEPRSPRRPDRLSRAGKLKNILRRTRGVPLFQEQAMQIAIDCAGFLPAKADKLRRAMATFRRSGTIHKLKDDFINGMLGNKYEREFAERCFQQIEGFGEYGFPESHAASFAILVYASSWVKWYYPEVFCRGAAQLPADGLLCAGAARARRPRARRRGAAARRERQRLGLHAREDGRPTLRPASRLPPGHGPAGSRHEAHGRRGARRPIAIRPTCGGAAG